MYSNPDDFFDRLDVLCRHFAAPVPSQLALATCLQDSPLLDSLIQNFDNPHFIHVSPLIAELFVNLSALDPLFATRFLKQQGYEKVIHVRDVWNSRKPILLILAYNIFSQGGIDSIRECLDFQIYLEKLSRALQTGDKPILYFSSFVLTSLLRSAPLSESDDHAAYHKQFVAVMGDVLREPLGRPIEIAMWAVYFWLKTNVGAEPLWDALTPWFVGSVAGLLYSENPLVVRLALYALACLWLIPNEPRRARSEVVSPQERFERSRHRKEVIGELKKVFDYDRVCELIADDDAGPYASVLMTNFVAFDVNTARAMRVQMHVFDVAMDVLRDGSAQAKIEAGRLLCLLLYQLRDEEREQFVNEDVIGLLIDALSVEDYDLTRDVLGLFSKWMARAPSSGPDLKDVLLALDFDEYLTESQGKFDLDELDERVFEVLERRRQVLQHGIDN
jgi:hypothetical protein